MKTPAKSKTGNNRDEDSLKVDKSIKSSKAKKLKFDDESDMDFENLEDFIEFDFDEDDDY